MKTNLLWQALVAAAVVALAGCSAIQIDVDVYKGPLANEPEIQSRQFAALARSAKPVLQLITKSASENQKEQLLQLLLYYTPVSNDQDRQWREAYFPTSIPEYTKLPQQADTCTSNTSNDPRNAQGVKGLMELASKGKDDLMQQWGRDGRPCEGLDFLHDGFLEKLTKKNGNFSDRDVVNAQQKLVDAYIVFAERMLFVVNNSNLFTNDYTVERSVLQTVGNSILLHANDLRRRDKHELSQQGQFAHELEAAGMANTFVPPSKIAAQLSQALEKSLAEAKRAATQLPEVLTAKAQISAANAEAKAATERLAIYEKLLQEWNQEPLRAAYLTLAKPDAKPAFGPKLAKPLVFDAAAAASDKSKIEALVKTKAGGANIDGATLRDVTLEWISQQDRDAGLSSDRLYRLRNLAAFLRSSGLAFDSMAAQPSDALLAGIKGELEQRKVDAEKDWAAKVAARDQAAQTQKKASDAIAPLVKAAEQTLAKALEGPAVKTAGDALTRGKTELDRLSKDAQAGGFAHPEAFRGAVISALAQAATSASGDDANALRAAGQTLRGVLLVPGFNYKLEDFKARCDATERGKCPQAIDVVDDVITLLRNQRIRALAEGKAEDAANLQAAIDAAYEQRTSLVYLRPAVEYLRNVYSATALQEDSAKTNSNMLLDYLRNLLPEDKVKALDRDRSDSYAAGNTATNSAEAPTLHEAKRQLEKVFWQNINRVTLTGGGATNNVLAKDDVGNWYIKTYGSDPKQIFESAKNLALFNRGAALDINLLERAELRRKSNDTSLTETERKSAQDRLTNDSRLNPAAMTFAKKSQERSLDTFAAEQVKAANDLASLADKLSANLEAAWRADLKDSQEVKADQLDAVIKQLLARTDALKPSLVTGSKALAAAAKTLSDAKEAKIAPSDSLTADTLTQLDVMRALRKSLAADIAATTLDPKPADVDRAKLVASVRRVLRDPMDTAVKRLQRANDNYLDSLTVLGDVVASK